MGNLVFGSGAEPGRASKARGGLTESPMERDYDATESDRERYTPSTQIETPSPKSENVDAICSHTSTLTTQTLIVVKGTVFTVKTLKWFDTITMYTIERSE